MRIQRIIIAVPEKLTRIMAGGVQVQKNGQKTAIYKSRDGSITLRSFDYCRANIACSFGVYSDRKITADNFVKNLQKRRSINKVSFNPAVYIK